MPFGVLEYHGPLEHVTGTVQLEEVETTHTSHLKRGTGKDAGVFLIPQPSNNPNDPLNWPVWQKDMILTTYLFSCLLAVGAVGPILASITVPIADALDINFTKVSLLTGYQLCAVGASAIFVSGWVVKYGRRLAFIISTLFLLGGTAWVAAATSYESMLGGRIIQGIGSTFFEGPAYGVIGDLYFVHQRGSRMALFNTAQSGILLLPSLIAGVVAKNLGWRWVFWIMVVVVGMATASSVLIGWETMFDRNALYNIDASSIDNMQIIEDMKTSKEEHQENLDRTLTLSSSASRPRDSYWRRLKLTSGSHDDTPIWRLFCRPLIVCLNPAAAWAITMLSMTLLWNVVTNLLISQFFSVEPYNLDSAQIGYLFVGPILGGLTGNAICGFASDPLVKWASKRNKGVYEPEFRLILMVLLPVSTSVGYFLFGNMLARHTSEYAMAVIWGIAFISVQIAMSSIGAYLVDGYRAINTDIFVAVMGWKNFVTFGFSFFQNNWVADWGPKRTYNFIAGLMLGLAATTIPIYMFGKRIRAWWQRIDLLKNF